MKTVIQAAAIALAVGLLPVGAMAADVSQQAGEAANSTAEAAGDIVDTVGAAVEDTADAIGNAFGGYDEDRDEALSEQEYERVRGDFQAYDRDRSGDIDQSEFNEWGNETWGGQRTEEDTAGLFEDWDQDRNQALSEDEWGGGPQFSDLDRDQSGAIDIGEGWN